MTNQVLESAPPVSPVATPTAPVGAAGGQATSPDIGAVLARLDKAEQELRGLQSVGDKREAKLTEKFGALEDYFKRTGGQIDPRVIRDMQVDEILAQRNSQQIVSPGSGAPLPTPQPSVDYLAIYKALGVDPNSNEVLHLTTQHAGDTVALSAALVQHKIQQANRPPPSAAAVLASPGSGVGTASDDQQAKNIMEQLTTLRAQASPDRKRIAELTAELRKLTP